MGCSPFLKLFLTPFLRHWKFYDSLIASPIFIFFMVPPPDAEIFYGPPTQPPHVHSDYSIRGRSIFFRTFFLTPSPKPSALKFLVAPSFGGIFNPPFLAQKSISLRHKSSGKIMKMSHKWVLEAKFQWAVFVSKWLEFGYF